MMNEAKIGLFQRFYYSIVSFDKYRLFLRQGTGKAVVYLLLLSLIASIAVLVPMAIEFNRIMDTALSGIDSYVPDFKLADGKLEVSSEMPIVIEDGAYPIVIDTRPGAEDRILNEYDVVLLITSDKIIQKNYVNKSVTNLSMFQGMVITKDSLKQVLPIMKPIGIVIFILTGIILICGKYISALLISVIGLIINSAKGTQLSYRSIFKFSVYSMTLPLIICTVLDLLPINVPLVWVLFYAIASVYIYGAINSIKKEIDGISRPENTGDPGGF